MHPFDIIMVLLLWCGAGHAAYWHEFEGDIERYWMVRICYARWAMHAIYAMCLAMGPFAWLTVDAGVLKRPDWCERW